MAATQVGHPVAPEWFIGQNLHSVIFPDSGPTLSSFRKIKKINTVTFLHRYLLVPYVNNPDPTKFVEMAPNVPLSKMIIKVHIS